ncbi:hypothetical protein SELMODRAFT_417828 [Selaginella moellendorffii]|uniref:RanBP2-type domain-containing protein n=1 Tax=Selaginella moellendorffii TaxID=88036 RepID=D8S3S4_SELML|nr:hypothetical protein SELMODRAFT_417828 [Selaginella moellendorffii]
MTRSSGAREGDWKCSGCSNRNYAFRSLCNRCKQPRILVDTDTPPDSKWLPRIGDWICAGCSNNNYASRDKCNKCGKPRDVAALPLSVAAAAGSGAAVSAPLANGAALGLNMGIMPAPISLGTWNMNAAALARSVRLSDNTLGGVGGGGGGGGGGGNWRIGDWTCTCGYVNYASRTTCKQCHSLPAIALPQQNLSTVGYQGIQSYALPQLSLTFLLCLVPETLVSGVKRQASDELSNDWVTKRPHVDLLHQAYMASFTSCGGWNDRSGLVLGGLNLIPNLGLPNPAAAAALQNPPNVGKGAKHWRAGDWICTNCDNHNYASRECCNRCGRDKDAGRPMKAM